MRAPIRALALASALAILAACSSAPKSSGVVYEIKNKAAEYARLGDGFMATGQYDQALTYYGEALRSSASVDDLVGASSAQASMGRAYLSAGMLDEARAAFAASLESAVMSGSPVAQAVAKTCTGELLNLTGEREKALALFEEAAHLVAPGGKVPVEDSASKAFAVALHDSAVAKSALGRKAEALADLEKAKAINQKLKRWTELAANHYVHASILAGAGKLDEALATALAALAADKLAENGRGIAGDLAAAGSLAARLERKDEAFAYWKRSFDTALAVDDARAARAALVALVPLCGELGRDADRERYATLLEKLDEAKMQAGK